MKSWAWSWPSSPRRRSLPSVAWIRRAAQTETHPQTLFRALDSANSCATPNTVNITTCARVVAQHAVHRQRFLRQIQGSKRAVNGGGKQPQDVKLVGDELGFGEEAAREVAVRVGHVERHPAHVLAARDVLKRGGQLGAALAFH